MGWVRKGVNLKEEQTQLIVLLSLKYRMRLTGFEDRLRDKS